MLTVKDFIKYNNPCFFCKTPIELLIRSSSQKNTSSVRIKNTNLDANTLDFDIKITYLSILNLKINHTHNRFISNDVKALTEYLREYSMSFILQCANCGTHIYSKNLEFDINKQLIKPLTISMERLHYVYNGTLYSLISKPTENSSLLTASTGALSRFTHGLSPGYTTLNLKYLPLKYFKDPDHFIQKMKTYLIFT